MEEAVAEKHRLVEKGDGSKVEGWGEERRVRDVWEKEWSECE